MYTRGVQKQKVHRCEQNALFVTGFQKCYFSEFVILPVWL